mgnify:CR=1 FL=1
MLELGIPAHLRGYYYLREAVLLAVSDMELVGSVTKLNPYNKSDQGHLKGRQTVMNQESSISYKGIPNFKWRW